jgi:LuxR family transcriptional regulator, maltose regulon positive regulatory protein
LGRPEALVALFEHGAAARMGRGEQTRAVLHWAAERLGETGDVLYLRAWAPASVSRYDAARGHLRPLLDGSAEAVRPWVLVDAWLLECHIALRLGGHARAREALQCALEYADQLGALRPLVGAPAEVAALMARQLPGLGRLTGVAEESLGLRRERAAGPPEVPLTNRERAVLALLPSLMPLGEIAEELSVSVNAVRWTPPCGSVCSTRRRSAEVTTGRTVTRPLTTRSCRRSVPRRDEAGGPCPSSGPAVPGPARGAPTGPCSGRFDAEEEQQG